MSNPLEYQDIVLPEDAVFKISPSQFSKFIEKVHQWYRSEVLKEEGFTYSTSTVLGTIVHYCAECAAKDEKPDIDVIDQYIYMHEENDDYDPEVVQSHYKAMATVLINSYVLPNRDNYLSVEMQAHALVKNGFYAGGSLDVLQGTKEDCMIVDYKTYNSKTKPKSVPSYYKYQLLVYAFILRLNGYNVTRIRLVYVNRNIDGGVSEKTGKPLKSYPPEVTELTELLTEDDMDFIENQLNLCVDTVEAGIKYPELIPVIYHDPRLKE